MPFLTPWCSSYWKGSLRVTFDYGRQLLLFMLTRLIIFTKPSARAGYDTKSIFKWSLTSFNSEFSFSKTSCLTKAEEPSLPYYLPIAGGRIIGFIPFPRVLVLCEMQPVSSRIRTRVTMSISPRAPACWTCFSSAHFVMWTSWVCWTHSIYYASPARVPVHSLN